MVASAITLSGIRSVVQRTLLGGEMALNVDIPRRTRIKTTSREAYERIKESGQLSRMRMKAW